MKRTTEYQSIRTILAAFIAAIGLAAPLASLADEPRVNIQNQTRTDSQIEVGAGYLTDESFKFGDYGRALGQSGTHLFGNVQMNTLGENASYLNVIGRNLGPGTNWNIGIMSGELGSYGFRFEYDELSKLHSDSYQTPYDGMGTTHLTRPAGWAGTIDVTPGGAIDAPVASTIVTTAMMTGLAANMKQFNVETKRKTTGLGLTKQLAGGWDVAATYKIEEKDGTKLTGAPMQIGGQGNRGTLLAPEPINYTTGQFDAVARYADERLHMQLGYYVSLFNNVNRSLVFDNLFYNGASTVGGNALTGQLGQMPSNQFHQINASGGYTISKETRLTGSLSQGRMTQNEVFLPYSTAGNMPAATSLNGKIDTTHADLKLSSELTHELNLAVGYRYDDRENRTPVNTYTYQTADVTTAPGASNTRRNTPLSKTQQVSYADLGYHLSSATKLRLGYDYEQITHTYEPTGGDREHTVKAEVTHGFSDTASGGLAYAHSDRNASDYNGAAPLMATYTATYLASLCVAPNTFLYNGIVTACTATATATSTATTPFLDTPSLRKFFLADRKRDKLRAFANISPSEKLDLQLGASYYKEKYPEAEIGFGLAKATGWTTNFDANLAATETLTGVFFASIENYKTDQNGHNGSSNAGAGITTLDRQNNTAAFDALTGAVTRADRSLTAGLGFRVKPDSSYEWGGDFTRAKTTGTTSFSNIGSLVTAILPVPITVSQLNRLELFGKYKMQKDLTLSVKYAYEKYSSTDWAWDGQTFTSSTSFVGSGQTSPDYRINMINVSFTYLF